MDIVTYNDPSTAPPFHVNLLVTGNQSTGWEGAADGSILTWGAGQSPSFVHCTVADNVGALLTGGLQAVESNPLVVNSIFWGNHGPGQDCEICYDPAWDPSVWYSNIYGGWTGAGDGNIDDPPGFVVGGYRLKENSPCIDTAFDLPFWYPWITEYVNHDLDQQSRPVGAGYDMGCYERQPWEED
jgi:hypothetical protein